MSHDSAPQELVITRLFNAPRVLVFRAWTDPNHLAQWWGPHGFTNPVCEVDLRPGGTIRIDMADPSGMVYPMIGVFREIVEPERLVFTSGAFMDDNGVPQLEALNTVTLVEVGNQTELTLHTVVLRAGPMTLEALAGMEAGWTQSLEKLTDLLAA